MRSNSIWIALPAIGALTLASNVANAADLGSGPPLLQNAPLLVDEFGSNWYLRGDVGYRFNNDLGSVDSVGLTPAALNPDLSDKTWVFGGGFGYKWEWFRIDVTGDYGTKARFSADSAVRANDFNARIDSVTGLVNVYGDLGTWWGFTPYIGAGAGFSHLRASNFRINSADAGESGSTGSTNFAWAYMAGFSYRVSPNYHIDVGYRHVNMGDVATGIDLADNQLKFKNVSADEVRIGFRYIID